MARIAAIRKIWWFRSSPGPAQSNFKPDETQDQTRVTYDLVCSSGGSDLDPDLDPNMSKKQLVSFTLAGNPRITFGYFCYIVCDRPYPVVLWWSLFREGYLWLGNKYAQMHECWLGMAFDHIPIPLVTFSDSPSRLEQDLVILVLPCSGTTLLKEFGQRRMKEGFAPLSSLKDERRADGVSVSFATC
ncbi:hypothetical protein LIER_02002 [Lithospermum erythrorhizon]|uniref:Sulfotransferase n=1 Tax=Lithospermum erythrorhizon TaxID=34254 RepID=A0AAV3NMZ7_LITER